MQLNDAWRRAIEEGVASDYGDHYLRAVFTFETGSATYGWLNSRLFIGEGRFPAAGTIEYRISNAPRSAPGRPPLGPPC